MPKKLKNKDLKTSLDMAIESLNKSQTPEEYLVNKLEINIVLSNLIIDKMEKLEKTQTVLANTLANVEALVKQKPKGFFDSIFNK